MTWTPLLRSEGAAGLSCHVTGKGPLMVLIHGVGLRSDAWGGLLPMLEGHFRCVAVDMPGHGQSRPASSDASDLATYTARIAAFLEPFGRPAAVVGHSMGAMIALDLAIRRPELVTSVVALNAIFQRDEAARDAVTARAASLSDHAVADPAAPLDRWFGTSPTGPVREARDACEGWLKNCDPKGYAAAYRVFAAHDGPDPDDLARLHCPALFITGEDEPNSTPAMSRQMAELAPQGQAHVIPGAAHMAPMTHSAQIARIMRDALSHRQAA